MLSKIPFSNQKNILHILIFFILPLPTKWILNYFVVIFFFLITGKKKHQLQIINHYIKVTLMF